MSWWIWEETGLNNEEEGGDLVSMALLTKEG